MTTRVTVLRGTEATDATRSVQSVYFGLSFHHALPTDSPKLRLDDTISAGPLPIAVT